MIKGNIKYKRFIKVCWQVNLIIYYRWVFCSASSSKKKIREKIHLGPGLNRKLSDFLLEHVFNYAAKSLSALFLEYQYNKYRVRHIKCYRGIALKLLIISKNVSDKSFSVREGRHTRLPYFFYRWRRWSYVKVNSNLLNGTMYFIVDDIINEFKTNSATYNTRSF